MSSYAHPEMLVTTKWLTEHLDDPDVHALLKHVGGKAVAERVRSKLVVEAALASRFVECGSRGGVGQVRDDAATGE